jgi:hypothetical protein
MPGEHHLFTKRCEIGRYGRTSDSTYQFRLEMFWYIWLVLAFLFEEGSTGAFDLEEPTASEGLFFMR